MMGFVGALCAWLVGGLVGLHHLYLGRPRQAFLYSVTFGYCGIGWLLDLFFLFGMSRKADRGEAAGPASRVSVLLSQLTVGILFASIATCLPPRDVYDLLPRDQYLLLKNSSFACGAVLGVWSAGNREGAHVPLGPLVVVATTCLAIFDWTYASLLCVVAEAQREFSRTHPEGVGKLKSTRSKHTVLHYYFKVAIFSLALSAAVLQHGTYTHTPGQGDPLFIPGRLEQEEEIRFIGDDIRSFMQSEDMTIVLDTLKLIWDEVQHVGFARIIEKLLEALAQDDEGDSLRVLGLDEGATMQDIKRAYRTLSLVHHPDKWASASPEEQKRAQQEFIKVKEAYEMLRGV